ncbi:MAG: hypothetical protein OXB88_11180, partial [Bacteriovoracales bacterium]|nr:hypothetical protein [Bacteriovoracales bacterium]
IFGNDSKSIESFLLEMGGRFRLSSQMSLEGSLETVSNRVRFGENKGLLLIDTVAKLGVNVPF